MRFFAAAATHPARALLALLCTRLPPALAQSGSSGDVSAVLPDRLLPEFLPALHLLHVDSPQDELSAAIEDDGLAALRQAVNVMQSVYFQLWVGKWPTAIDWTAAVVNTYLIDTVATFGRRLHLSPSRVELGHSLHSVFSQDLTNDINRYFSQTVAYYFGEDILALRNEAYDDMLWVVLGWLDAIKFLNSYSSDNRHHSGAFHTSQNWHGSQFVSAFAHRARVFYDIAAQGWDTTLCGGGMIWNPVLEPYKNAITNQLYISASIGMYLDHPGDNNSSPFGSGTSGRHAGLSPAQPHDPSYLNAAIQAYDWFKNSNMTNHQGLVVDGFHITGWDRNGSIGTGKCDNRNEMVYTYNQAVVLSGLRGLWESTGDRAYLADAHNLTRNAIRATGWVLQLAVPTDNLKWAGLGRAGILEEVCDSRGQCSQDGQTFKGIFFHHLALLCQPLPTYPRYPGLSHAANEDLAHLHHQSCREYAPWVAHNARAAVATRDERGRFGTWWGAHLNESVLEADIPVGAIDYRNRIADPDASAYVWTHETPDQQLLTARFGPGPYQKRLDASARGSEDPQTSFLRDANDRGRGRTVETQGGGVAVLHALWNLGNAA